MALLTGPDTVLGSITTTNTSGGIIPVTDPSVALLRVQVEALTAAVDTLTTRVQEQEEALQKFFDLHGPKNYQKLLRG